MFYTGKYWELYIMSNLFIIQSEFASTPQAIKKLQAVHTPNDVIILMGDAVQFIIDPFLQSLYKIYIIETDLENLPPINMPNVEVIQYNDFADICLQHTRCISLK